MSALASVAMTVASTTTTVWVSDGSDGLGRRVLQRLNRSAQLIEGLIGDSDVVVWLASADADARARRRQSATEGVTAALAEAEGARHLVLVSSAMVYGAWANNPVPHHRGRGAATRCRVRLRPPIGAGRAARRRVAARTEPGRTVTVLRPVVGMAADSTVGLAAALAAGMGQRFGEDDPPAQFLHLDDLASAVVLAAEQRLDGVFNVAPGWLGCRRAGACAGRCRAASELPDRMTEVIGNAALAIPTGPDPPGPAQLHALAVARRQRPAEGRGLDADGHQRAGLRRGTEAKWWTMVTPKRRQEIALGGLTTLLVAVGIVTWRAVRRAERNRRRPAVNLTLPNLTSRVRCPT